MYKSVIQSKFGIVQSVCVVTSHSVAELKIIILVNETAVIRQGWYL